MSGLGVIGLGTMGWHMARRLAEAGYAPLVHDLVDDRRGQLESAGARWASSVREIADAATIVLVSLPTPAVVEQVLVGPDGLVSGGALGVVIDTSTTGPEVSRRCAAALAGRGIDLVDAPVSGGPSGADSGSLSIMASGRPEALARVMPVLEVVGARIFRLGPEPGQGQMMKVINNTICAAAALASFEGLVLGARAGLDAETMLAVLNASSGRNFATEVKVPECILHRNFPQRFSTALLHKDVSLCLEEAARLGVPTWVGDAARQMLSFAVGQGGGAMDYGHLIRHYESWAGAQFGRAPEHDPREAA